MDKIRLDLGTQEETFEFNGVEIIVRPIDINMQAEIASEYLGELFHPDAENRIVAFTSRDRIGAVTALRLVIIDRCTNIAVMDEDGNPLIDIEKIVASGLWDELEQHIPNYYDFETMLARIEADVREENILEKSLGAVIAKVGDSISKMLDALASSEVSDENISRIEKLVSDLKDGIKSSPVGGLLKEAG